MDNQSAWRRVSDVFFGLINGAAWVFFVLMIAVMLLQVSTRYIYSQPLPWTEEASRFSYIWAIFLGAAIAQRSRSHMTVTILTEALPHKVQMVMQVLTDLFSAAVLLGVLYGTYIQMGKTYRVLASSIDIRFSYIYLSLAIGAGCMLLLYVYQFVQDFRALFSSNDNS